MANKLSREVQDVKSAVSEAEDKNSVSAGKDLATQPTETLRAAQGDGQGCMDTSADGWRCFHCDEVFNTREEAAEHFGNGDYEAEIPLCVEAATTEQRKLILTNREMWEELQKAQSENEELEYQLHGFEYLARKLTKKPSATMNDLEHEWDFMEGRVIVAEETARAALAAAHNAPERNTEAD